MKRFILAVAAAFAFFFSPATAQAQSANCTVVQSDWSNASKELGTRNFAPTSAGDFSRRLADWAIADTGKQAGMNIPAACREAFVAAMTSKNRWTADTPWSAVGETVFFPRVMQVAAPAATTAPAPTAQAVPAATSNQEAQAAAEQAQRNAEAAQAAAATRRDNLVREEEELAAMPQTRPVQAERAALQAEIRRIDARLATLAERIATIEANKADMAWVRENFASQASVTALTGRVTAVEGTANTALSTANAAQSAAAQAEAKADAAAKIANQALEANQGAATQADLNAVSLVGALAFGLLLLLIVGLIFWVRSLRAKIQAQPTAAPAPGEELDWGVHPLRDAA